MIELIRSFANFAYLYLLRRRQQDSVRLRHLFSRKYDIEVGLYSYGCFDRWRMPGPMQVGRYCSIASTARTILRNHPLSAITTHPILFERAFGAVDSDIEPGPPLIVEDDVWIGHNVVITPGCKYIGRGAVIGAGAIVTKDVDPYSVVAGNPAIKLRDRFSPDIAAAIETSRWWELDLEELRRLVRSRPSLIFGPSESAIEAWIRDTKLRQ